MEDILTPEGRFNYALHVVLDHEGGYSNDKDDPGGETNFGITQNDLDRVFSDLHIVSPIKDLTKAEAKIFYRKEFWDKYHYNAINNLNIVTKIFDIAVNMGPEIAHKIAQKSCNYFGCNLHIDGILGGKTIGAINEICGKKTDSLDLILHLSEQQKTYYRILVNKNPKLLKFLDGWLKRGNWIGHA